MDPSEIRTSQKYLNAVPRQTDDEREMMLQSITARGIDKPLEISSLTGLLVDGFERLTVGKKAGITKFPATYKDFASEEEEMSYVISNSLCRRNLTTWWVGKLNHRNVEIQKKIAMQRKKAGKKQVDKMAGRPQHDKNQSGDKETLLQICNKVHGRSVDIATRGRNISPRTQSAVEKILKSGDQDIIKKLDRHEITTHKAEQMIRRQEAESVAVPPLPRGKFNHIVEDPGWSFGNERIGGNGKSGASHHYRTEDTASIAKMPVSLIAADDAVLYMWTTNQHLITGTMAMSEYLQILGNRKPGRKRKSMTESNKAKELRQQQAEAEAGNAAASITSGLLEGQKVQSDALAVMRCHGFEPKCIVTWEKEDKPGWGGYWLSNTTEHLLIGVRGRIRAFGLQEKTIIKSRFVPKAHSKKPEEAWHLIEKCVQATRKPHKKLELNCRNPRKGWHPHGDQITAEDIIKWRKTASR